MSINYKYANLIAHMVSEFNEKTKTYHLDFDQRQKLWDACKQCSVRTEERLGDVIERAYDFLATGMSVDEIDRRLNP